MSNACSTYETAMLRGLFRFSPVNTTHAAMQDAGEKTWRKETTWKTQSLMT
jgi:hypothetical protein